MVEDGYVSKEEAGTASAKPLTVVDRTSGF